MYQSVIVMDYGYINEMTDDTNSPILVILDSRSEGVWAVFTKKKGDSAHVKNKVANIIRGVGYSKIVIKSDQEPKIKSENDFAELCGFQVVMHHSPVEKSAVNGVIENAIQRVQGQVRAIKLHLETNIKAGCNPSQTIWLSLLSLRISGDDGLTAIQRIRRRPTTAL